MGLVWQKPLPLGGKMTIEEAERIRLWLVILAGLFGMSATILSAWIEVKKPG